jgi:hypothetical protein
MPAKTPRKRNKEDSIVEHVQTAVDKECLPNLETIGMKLNEMEIIDSSTKYATYKWSLETISKILGNEGRLENLDLIGKWLVDQGVISQNKPDLVLDWSLDTIISNFLDAAKKNVPLKR